MIHAAARVDAAALQWPLLILTRWLERRERDVVAYLVAENRLLRRQLGTRRVRLTDADRRSVMGITYLHEHVRSSDGTLRSQQIPTPIDLECTWME